jgi:hypothetical protein
MRSNNGDGRLLALGFTWAEAWIVPVTCAGFGGPPAHATNATATLTAVANWRPKILTVLFSHRYEKENSQTTPLRLVT